MDNLQIWTLDLLGEPCIRGSFLGAR